MPTSLNGYPFYFKEKYREYTLIGDSEAYENIFYLDGDNNKSVTALIVIRKVYAFKNLNDYNFPKSHLECSKLIKSQNKKPPSFAILPQGLSYLDETMPYADECINKDVPCFIFKIKGDLFEERIIENKLKLRPLPFYHAAFAKALSHEYEEMIVGNGKFCRILNKLWADVVEHEDNLLISKLNYDHFFITMFSIDRQFDEDLEKAIQFTNLWYRGNSESLFSKKNPLTDFIHSIWDSYLTNLTLKRIIKRCPCGNIFKFKVNKTYCSYQCRKRKDNKKYYNDNQEEQRQIKKDEVKEYRALKKKYRVKKA
jgi:hypothetical protein